MRSQESTKFDIQSEWCILDPDYGLKLYTWNISILIAYLIPLILNNNKKIELMSADEDGLVIADKFIIYKVKSSYFTLDWILHMHAWLVHMHDWSVQKIYTRLYLLFKALMDGAPLQLLTIGSYF